MQCPVSLGIDLSDSAADYTVMARAAMKDGKVTILEHKTLSRQTSEIGHILEDIKQACQTQSFQPVPWLYGAAK